MNTRLKYILLISLIAVAAVVWSGVFFDNQLDQAEADSQANNGNETVVHINVNDNIEVDKFLFNELTTETLSQQEVQKLIQADVKNKQEIIRLKKLLTTEQLKSADAKKTLDKQQNLIVMLSNNNERLVDKVASLDNQVNINEFNLKESLKREIKLNATLKKERMQHANLLSSPIEQIKSTIDQKPDLLKTTKSGGVDSNVINLDTNDDDIVDVNEEKFADIEHFSGAVEFGFNFEQDNLITKNVQGRLILDYNVIEQYNINSDMQFKYKNEDSEDTEDKWRWQLQGNYNLTPSDTAFIRSDIQRSKFASYKQEETFTIGHGHIFFNENNHKFNTELGPGYKLAVPNDDYSVSINEFILRTRLNYERVVTENLQVTMEGIVELGRENSVYETEIRAQNRIYQELYLIFDVNYRYNQNVPVDNVNGEFSTGLNLQYAF